MKSDASSSGGEVRRKPSRRMDDDSSLGTYSLGIKNVRERWEMSDKEEDLQRKGRGLFPKDGKWSKKMSSLRLMTLGRMLRRSTRSSIDYRMTWWNMREWKEILRNILMLWYSKKGVLMLMLIRKTINHSKACGKCRNLSNESS